MDCDEENFQIGTFRRYDANILKRCLVPCGPDGVNFHHLCDEVWTITGYADAEYTSNSWVRFSGIDTGRGGVTFDTVGMIMAANLWLHMLIDDPITSKGSASNGLSVRYDLEELGWALASHLGCSTDTVHDVLRDTVLELHVEEYYATRYQEVASCVDAEYDDDERLSRMVEVLIRSPVVIEPVRLDSIINNRLMKWMGVPYIDDDRHDQILDIVKRWEYTPIGISALAYSTEIIEYKYQRKLVKGFLPNGEIRTVVVSHANKDMQTHFKDLPGYNARACSMFTIGGEHWLGEAHISYRLTDFRNGSTGTDCGAYVHHLTFYPFDARILTPEGQLGTVPPHVWLTVLKDVNAARRGMYQGDEGYNLTRKTEIGGDGGMWSHPFSNQGGYTKWCVATRRRPGPNVNEYVEMCLEDKRRVVVQVEDKGVRRSQVQQKVGLTGKKPMPEHFRSDLVRQLINGDAATMNGDTTVNVPARYVNSNAPMRIAHLAMAYTRIRSVIEDVKSNFGNEIEVMDYDRNANNFIVLLNALLLDHPPVKLKNIGFFGEDRDGSIMVDVFNIGAKMGRMGIMPIDYLHNI